ncbi:hypothetical protein HAQ01_03905 [Acidithiobacillus thiooxidans]|nr:hypothetical protein [Acidithiobacillus thiooxidans]
MQKICGATIVQKGPIIGQYENQPIHDFLAYDDQQVLRFSHVATVDRDGTIPLAQLSDEEVVVSPGLVYRLEREG